MSYRRRDRYLWCQVPLGMGVGGRYIQRVGTWKGGRYTQGGRYLGGRYTSYLPKLTSSGLNASYWNTFSFDTYAEKFHIFKCFPFFIILWHDGKFDIALRSVVNVGCNVDFLCIYHVSPESGFGLVYFLRDQCMNYAYVSGRQTQNANQIQFTTTKTIYKIGSLLFGNHLFESAGRPCRPSAKPEVSGLVRLSRIHRAGRWHFHYSS